MYGKVSDGKINHPCPSYYFPDKGLCLVLQINLDPYLDQFFPSYL